MKKQADLPAFATLAGLPRALRPSYAFPLSIKFQYM